MNKILILIFTLMSSASASAYKECPEQINTLYVGDDGVLWMTFKNGGAGYMRETDTDFKNTLSVALAAKMAGSNISVRYVSDSATCSDTRGDIQGIWIK